MTITVYAVHLRFPGEAPSAEVRGAQQDFLAELREQGTLLLAGPYTDGDGGGLAIVRAGSSEEVQEIYERSPLVRSGTAEFEVRQWNVKVGNEAFET